MSIDRKGGENGCFSFVLNVSLFPSLASYPRIQVHPIRREDDMQGEDARREETKFLERNDMFSFPSEPSSEAMSVSDDHKTPVSLQFSSVYLEVCICTAFILSVTVPSR